MGLGLSWKILQKNILPEFRSIECMRFSLVTLESYDNVGDNNVGEASSKAKKRKTSKNEDIEQIMGAIQDVALAMREGNLIIERSLAHLPIPDILFTMMSGS